MLRADVAQTQYSGTVGNDGYQVVTAGQLVRLVYILLDLQTGSSYAGSVSQSQIVRVGSGNGGGDADLALSFIVKL